MCLTNLSLPLFSVPVEYKLVNIYAAKTFEAQISGREETKVLHCSKLDLLQTNIWCSQTFTLLQMFVKVLKYLINRDTNHFNTHVSYTGALVLSRISPLACWFSSMLHCFGGAVLTGIMLAEPPIGPLSNSDNILLASIIW